MPEVVRAWATGETVTVPGALASDTVETASAWPTAEKVMVPVACEMSWAGMAAAPSICADRRRKLNRRDGPVSSAAPETVQARWPMRS